MRFHWFAAHLLFPAAVSIHKSVADVPEQMGTPSSPRANDLSFARSVDLPDRIRPSLAVPSLTAFFFKMVRHQGPTHPDGSSQT